MLTVVGLAAMVASLQPAATRPTAVAAPRVRASLYEGASQSRRTLTWRAPTASPNTAILGSLTTLRDRSREATRNNGYPKGAIDKLVTNIIGTGIKPLSQVKDAAFRAAVHALWNRWTDESDADGLLDFYGQQSQAVRGWFEGGEVFIRLRPRLPDDGLSVPLQVQVIEPELCPHTLNRIEPSGNRTRAGIEFNAIGRRVAYWFHPSRPGDLLDYDPAQLRRVPADRVIHLFDPLRPGQLRGLPLLTQALIKLRDLDQYDDATLLRQKIANLFVGFIKRPANAGDVQLDPLTGQPVDTSVERPMVPLEPALFQELDPGDDVTWSDPPDVGQTYPAFMKQQLFAVANATGVPYEVLTGDMSTVNDRTVRVILHEFRRRIQMWQHQIVAFQVCRRVWREWMDRAFLADALTLPADYAINATPWLAVKWMAQSWPYLHPVQDVQATREAIRSGLTTRSAAVAELGEDAEAIDQEQADDNGRADGLGLRYDSDGRFDRGGVDPQTDPAEQTPPAPTPAGASA